MEWSIPIGRIAGIRVYLHAPLFMLLGWLAFDLHSAGAQWQNIGRELGFVLAVFGCIVLHELGHALAARQFGIATLDITLLPIGGLARMERIPRAPCQEIVVALAGPAVNIVIVVVLVGAILLTRQGVRLDRWSLLHGAFLIKLLMVNSLLAGFNLLPAFPMDGGRVLRALLALRFSYHRSTRIAARIGQGMAVLFAVLAIQQRHWVLVLLGIFVFVCATWEMRAVQQAEAVSAPKPEQ